MSIQKILEENKDYILESLKNGISTSRLAKELNCHSGSIGTYAKKHGISSTFKQSKNHGKLDDNTEKIKEMYSRGMTAEKIGLELGFAKCSILRLLRKNGVDTTNKSRFNPPQTDKEYIIKAYNDGVNLQDIADKYNCSRPTISEFLKKSGVPSRERDFSQERIDVVKVYSEEKIGVEAVAQRFNVSSNFVKKMASKAGVMRDYEYYRHKVNQDYWKKIDTRNKAYFLGLMYADGNADKTGKGFKISLTEKDKGLLEDMKKDMEYEGPLQYRDNIGRKNNSKPEYILSVTRKDMCQDLVKLGCIPNKTWQIRFPEPDIVPSEFVADFCRGYFDGDGSIYKRDCSVAVIGNKFFIKGLLQHLPVTGAREYYQQSKRFKDDPDKQLISAFICKKHGVLDLMQFLYGDCDDSISLPRKKDRALYWLAKARGK